MNANRILVAGLLAASLAPAQTTKSYGCGVNPKGSLTVLNGTKPTIGTTVQFGIHNPLGTQGCGTFTALMVAPAPSPAYPCGLQLPSWGMTKPGAPGEFLVSPSFLLVRGPVWGCTSGPAVVRVSIPPIIGIVGSKVFAQGVMYDPASSIGFALTNGLEMQVGPGSRALAIGDTFGSKISPASEHEVFEFQGRAGDQLVIPYARTTGFGFSVRVELYDDRWNLLGTSESTSTEFRPKPLPATGSYRLVVRTRSGVTGSYHLSLQRTVDPVGSVSIGMGHTRGASIHPTWTDIDVYDFTARAGDALRIPFARTTGFGFSLKFDLYNDRGQLVATRSSTSSVLTPPPLPATGRYYLWVSNPGRNVTGSYHFSLQRTVDPGKPVQKKIGDSFGASIHPTWTEIDVYEFQALAGDRLFLPFARTTGFGFSLQLELFDAQGRRLGGTSGSSGDFKPGPLPTTGTYYLWISNPGRNVTGSYHVTLQRLNRPVTVGRIVPGTGRVYGSISPTWTEADVYELTALAGLKMVATYARTTGFGFSVHAVLRDAAGDVVQPGKNGSLTIDVSKTGTYYLWIRNPGRNVTGKYWVEVR